MTPEELKDWRERNGMTQSELAQALGVHLQTVWRWEHGTRDIPPYLRLALKSIERGERV